MRAKLKTPSMSMGRIYEDDRFKEKYAFNARGYDMTTIYRFRTKQEAKAMQAVLRRHGYALLKGGKR